MNKRGVTIMLGSLKNIFKNKKAFVWYLFEMEGKWLIIGLLAGLVVGILMAADIIPISNYWEMCPVVAAK